MGGEGQAEASPAIQADGVSWPTSPADDFTSPTSSVDDATSLMSPDSFGPSAPPSPPCDPMSPPPGSSSDVEDLRAKIIKQVEYYFSDENLPNDHYLLGFMKNREGFVPVGVIASFRKMKKLAQDISFIVEALKGSSQLVVSSDGKKVKRLRPMLCMVLVENLPADHSTENIRKIFGEVGNIKSISICDPSAAEESKRRGKVEMLISNKVHALVGYDTIEAAEKAVATLTNKKDWRNGMRVKLLHQIGKYGVKKKNWKNHDSDRNTSAQAPDTASNEEEHNLSSDETPDKGVDQHSKEKNGQGGKRKGRSSRHKYHGNNGRGHGTTSTSHGIETLKPPPGPRMPDGTRGFAMGRGRPPVPN